MNRNRLYARHAGRLALYILLLWCPLGAAAQSSMTDDQVLALVLKESTSGTSRRQLVTKLMQRGVDIQQIRRVKEKYERQNKQTGLGNVADQTVAEAETRMRQANGGTRSKTERSAIGKTELTDSRRLSTLRIQETPGSPTAYDEGGEDFAAMQRELQTFAPVDSLTLLRQLLRKQEQNKRRVFGRDIFNTQELSFEPSMNIATPQNYRLGPGDAVFVDIYGASQRSLQTTVSPDGDVNIEGFGPVQVSGLTIAQANARLRTQLGARYTSSKVRLTLGQSRTITVNVMGEVRTPGTYTLSAFASVFHALYLAGGTNDIGTLRSIKIYRNNRIVSTVDVYDYILNGRQRGNIRLAEGDVIYVGPYNCLVSISGKVKRPMYYEMTPQESLATLLKYAGGFTGDAYRKSVRVLRKTGRELAVYNVEEFDTANFPIADADSVAVDSILQRYTGTIELKGAVFRPGLYQVGGSINSLRTLIRHAEGLREEAFTARTVIHRMKPDRTLEVIAADLDGILAGRTPDIPLRENDVVFVPTKAEMMQQQTITIHGEIHFPGIYRYAENETLEDLVLQAGGLRETASTVKVDVARRIVDPRATRTDTLIARTYSFALKDGFVVDGTPGFTLMPFDEVYVRRSPGYSEQQNITVAGQVTFEGTYTLSTKTERLSDAIRKAGGITPTAYTKGARLERTITPDERLRMETLLRLARTQSSRRDSVDLAAIDLGNTYYVGIELDKALRQPGSDADITLRQGDRIIVPQYNATVKISGNVMYPNTVAYRKGKSAAWYIDQAGGFGNRAKRSRTYIIYMNGTVARVGHNANIQPGCEIVVPTKPEANRTSLTQWLGIGTSAASLATMLATIANLVK